jgi:hypothetical protein
MFLPVAASAHIDSVTPNPAQTSVPVHGAVTFNVAWRVARTADPAGGGGNVAVTSAGALLKINGATIATLGGLLSQQSVLAPGNSTVLNFSEVITVSGALARRISKARAGTVSLSRLFDDTEIIQGTGTVQIASSNAGPLVMRRIELKFENGARTDVVQKGDTIRAVADISFRSNGLLRGEWRLVDPSASLGGSAGGRRVLHVVRQQLVSSGEGRQRIVSPPLPTNRNGLYFLSFSVEDTDGTIETPILRYFVLEGHDNVPPTNLSVLTPSSGASIDMDTVFSWNAVLGTHAYQLEILNAGTDTFVAAKLVPATDLKLSLLAMSFENLTPGQTYDWRVRAFANGKVISQSKRYTLQVK